MNEAHVSSDFDAVVALVEAHDLIIDVWAYSVDCGWSRAQRALIRDTAERVNALKDTIAQVVGNG